MRLTIVGGPQERCGQPSAAGQAWGRRIVDAGLRYRGPHDRLVKLACPARESSHHAASTAAPAEHHDNTDAYADVCAAEHDIQYKVARLLSIQRAHGVTVLGFSHLVDHSDTDDIMLSRLFNAASASTPPSLPSMSPSVAARLSLSQESDDSSRMFSIPTDDDELVEVTDGARQVLNMVRRDQALLYRCLSLFYSFIILFSGVAGAERVV